MIIGELGESEVSRRLSWDGLGLVGVVTLVITTLLPEEEEDEEEEGAVAAAVAFSFSAMQSINDAFPTP